MDETDNVPDLREQAEFTAESNFRKAIESLVELDYSYLEILTLLNAAT